MPLSRPDLDLADPVAVDVVSALRPSIVIHTAALTNVDRCARDPEAATRANGLATCNVADACRATGARLVYVSTNEVFSGRRCGAEQVPYREDDAPEPINPYGASKLAGEHAVQGIVAEWAIVRTAWLYGAGNDFVAKILQRARTGPLRVVDDEIGSPTAYGDLVDALVQLVECHGRGIFHFVNEGACSRYAFASEILRVLGRTEISCERIPSSAFVRASTPPAYAPLANTRGAALGIRLRPWRLALHAYLGIPELPPGQA